MNTIFVRPKTTEQAEAVKAVLRVLNIEFHMEEKGDLFGISEEEYIICMAEINRNKHLYSNKPITRNQDLRKPRP